MSVCDLLFQFNPKLKEVKGFRQFMDEQLHIKFEKFDKDNKISGFVSFEKKGWMDCLIAHRNASYPCFLWTNFDEWIKNNHEGLVSKLTTDIGSRIPTVVKAR